VGITVRPADSISLDFHNVTNGVVMSGELSCPGADPTTSEFTTTSFAVRKRVFNVEFFVVGYS
jgi:hypothetical protein